MQDDADGTIARIAPALRPPPALGPPQKARVLVAVAAERDRARRQIARRGRVVRALGGGAALIAAGLLATVWVRSARTDRRSGTQVASVGSSPASPAAARLNNAPTDAQL